RVRGPRRSACAPSRPLSTGCAVARDRRSPSPWATTAPRPVLPGLEPATPHQNAPAPIGVHEARRSAWAPARAPPAAWRRPDQEAGHRLALASPSSPFTTLALVPPPVTVS